MSPETGTFSRPQPGDLVAFPGEALRASLSRTSQAFRELAGSPGFRACLDRVGEHDTVNATVTRHGVTVRSHRRGEVVEGDGPLVGSDWVMVTCPDTEGLRDFMTAAGFTDALAIAIQRRDIEVVAPAEVAS